MICDKCGKQNIHGEVLCANCGANMPAETICSGFADVLNYEGSETIQPVYKTEREDSKFMKVLLRKTDNVIKQTDKNLLISKIAVCVSVVVLGCSIVFGIMTVKSVNKAKNEIQSTINSLRTELRDSAEK